MYIYIFMYIYPSLTFVCIHAHVVLSMLQRTCIYTLCVRVGMPSHVSV